MGLSLQDQLLKAGIADKKQAKKANQEKRIKRKKIKARKQRLRSTRPGKNSWPRLNKAGNLTAGPTWKKKTKRNWPRLSS